MKMLITSPLAFNQEEMLRTEPASIVPAGLPPVDGFMSRRWTESPFKNFLIKAKFLMFIWLLQGV
jgi:hypothetical protein